jgi:hypothetical protein
VGNLFRHLLGELLVLFHGLSRLRTESPLYYISVKKYAFLCN